MTPSFPTPRSSDLTRHIPAVDLTAMAPHRPILFGSSKHHHERQQMFLARMSEASEWKAVPMRDPLRPALGVRVSNSVGQRRVPISRARLHIRTAFAQIMKAHPRTDDQHALIPKRRTRTAVTTMIRRVTIDAREQQ